MTTTPRTLTIAECLALCALEAWRSSRSGPRTLERLEEFLELVASLQYGPRPFTAEAAAVVEEARALAHEGRAGRPVLRGRIAEAQATLRASATAHPWWAAPVAR